MAGYESQLIMFLLTALSTLLGGIIKYLLNQIADRDKRIEKVTESSASVNEFNQQLATLYLAELKARAKADDP